MSQSKPNALSVADLFARYLEKQIDAHSAGLGYPESGDEATPFEAVPVQPVDPRLAWTDAVTAARLLYPSQTISWSVPPDWPILVNQQEPAIALAFALGNFPQMVRNLHPLLTNEPIALRQGPAQSMNVPVVVEWAQNATDEPTRYLAAGVLRLARRFDEAEQILAVPPSASWRALHANEMAALAWHRGEADKALALWEKQEPLAPVLFNRGMAAVFLGRTDLARASLDAAVAQLPETSAWHHLARLYATLAMVR